MTGVEGAVMRAAGVCGSKGCRFSIVMPIPLRSERAFFCWGGGAITQRGGQCLVGSFPREHIEAGLTGPVDNSPLISPRRNEGDDGGRVDATTLPIDVAGTAGCSRRARDTANEGPAAD
mmetsp:Transcript_39202/g.98092  ORF Transcript_39202/g.98092 Transcript_39202/m.98092 type:complete len:119 (-) Transcript_39202:385-741(-)